MVTITPAPHPFERLEEALQSISVDRRASFLAELAGSNGGIARAVAAALPEQESQLLLVVDQLGEIFTQVDQETARRFLDALAEAVQDHNSRVQILVTLRSDFFDRALRHSGLGQLLRHGTEIISEMAAEELASAIVGPLERPGITIEPLLVAELVREALGHPGALPLLQYALTELFDARRANLITHDAYRSVGGISGVLAQRAEGLLATLGVESKNVVREVFLRLLTLDDGGGPDTRRRALRTELEQLDVDPRVLSDVLDAFGRHRLLSFDRDAVTRGATVEIAHEAILTEWTRLKDWADAARDHIRNQRRLAFAMHEWTAADKGDDYLLRGGLFGQLRAWAETATLSLSADERHFLEASASAHDLEVRELRERQRQAAEAEMRIAAEEFRLASLAVLERDAELAMLLAVQAVKATAPMGFATEEAIDALHWALHRVGVAYPVGPDGAFAVRSGPEGLEGVFMMTPAALVALAEASTNRELTERESLEACGRRVPDPIEVPEGATLRHGRENYGLVRRDVLPDHAVSASRPLAGTRVTVARSSAAGLQPGFIAELRQFTDITGIDVTVVPNEDFQTTHALVSGEMSSMPDVSIDYGLPPTVLRRRAIDLGTYLDLDVLRSDFGDYLVDLFSTESESRSALQAIPVNLFMKGLVYYAKPEFEAAGYDIPTTWGELMELSHQMLAEGRTPWCFQWEGTYSSGWPGSDFLESLVLRVGGLAFYDQWVDGVAAFDSPEIKPAARLASAIFFRSGLVLGGSQSISREHFSTALDNLLPVHPTTAEIGPRCMMVDQVAPFIQLIGQTQRPNAWPTAAGSPTTGRLGEDVDCFVLPPVESDGVRVTTGSGDMAVALTDRPEVRAFMVYVASPSWGTAWARGNETFFSGNRRFDPAAYAVDRERSDAEVRLRIHHASRTALEAGTWRYSASDLMQPDIGKWTAGMVPGAFRQGMLDWVDQVKPIEEILADIESARRAAAESGDGPMVPAVVRSR